MRRYLVKYIPSDGTTAFCEFYILAKRRSQALKQAKSIICKMLGEKELEFPFSLQATKQSKALTYHDTNTHQGRVAAFNDARREGIAFGETMKNYDSFLCTWKPQRWLYRDIKQATKNIGCVLSCYNKIYFEYEFEQSARKTLESDLKRERRIAIHEKSVFNDEREKIKKRIINNRIGYSLAVSILWFIFLLIMIALTA